MTPAKPVLVGSFILGALALGVIAILTFGGSNLFAKDLRVVVVFKDSIAGLEVGAATAALIRAQRPQPFGETHEAVCGAEQTLQWP